MAGAPPVRLHWALPQADAAQRALAWDTGSIDQRVAALRDWRQDDPAGAHLALSGAWRAECDAATRRDGISTGADLRSGLGEKAGWVVDMLAAVEPRAWLDRFGDAPDGGRTPQALLTLEGSEFDAVLVRGWAMASAQHPMNDPASWLLALGQWWSGASPALRNAMPDSLFDALGLAFRHDEHGGLSALGRRLARRMVLRSAAGTPAARAGAPGCRQLAAPQSGRVLPRNGAALPALPTLPTLPTLPQPWAFCQLLSSLALALDPGPATRAADWHGTAIDNQWRNAFGAFSATVRLRHEMILSFQDPA